MTPTGRRTALSLGVAGVLAAALASVPWCRAQGGVGPPVAWKVQGPLRAGAGARDIDVPYPVPVVGYGPPRGEVRSAVLAPQARALVLQEGAHRLGLVELDLLTVPEELISELQPTAAQLGVDGLVVSASHSHSSIGGYSQSVIAQLAATGRYRPRVHAAVARAAAQALEQAVKSLVPARVQVGSAKLPQVVSRNEVPQVDQSVTLMRFLGAQGPIGQLVLLAAHPTLVDRHPGAVDPDYPGRLAHEERSAHGVTLVLQSAGGNATVERKLLPAGGDPAQVFAQALAGLLDRPALAAPEPVTLGYARDELHLPSPDASRLVPGWASGAGCNFLCWAAPRSASVALLQLGPVRWVVLPFEVTEQAAQAITRAAGADRVLSVSDGYLGYLDVPERVEAGGGESRRQYFGPRMLSLVSLAASADARAFATLP